jgi:glyoxylase-like metal-dependent hydrolase (beta-lactamase superfamily II)
MREILKSVYLEDGYPGVQVGALVLEKGVIMIDAPPRPDDGRAWLATLRGMSAGNDRLLINLDSHSDRTLGVRNMDTTAMAQERTLKLFNKRPSIFKAQRAESGAEWELLSGLSGIRWLTPTLYFGTQAELHWGGTQVLLEHHPGPEPGATWVVLPEKQIVFIGDAVVSKQPPFLAFADLPTWIDTLEVLLSKEYKGWRVISSRSGLVNDAAIKDMRKVLVEIDKRMQQLGRKKHNPTETEKWVDKLFSLTGSLKKHKTQYSQRLKYGLRKYYARKYLKLSED